MSAPNCTRRTGASAIPGRAEAVTITLTVEHAEIAFDGYRFLFENELCDLRGDVEGLPSNKTIAWFQAHLDKTHDINDRYLWPLEQIEVQLDAAAYIAGREHARVGAPLDDRDAVIVYQDTPESLGALVAHLASGLTDEEEGEAADSQAVAQAILDRLAATR